MLNWKSYLIDVVELMEIRRRDGEDRKFWTHPPLTQVSLRARVLARWLPPVEDWGGEVHSLEDSRRELWKGLHLTLFVVFSWWSLLTTPPGPAFTSPGVDLQARMPTPPSPNPRAETRGKRVVERASPNTLCDVFLVKLTNHNSANRQATPEHLISSHLIGVESSSWAAPSQSPQIFLQWFIWANVYF